MKKNQNSRKLNLNPETLLQLNNAELEAVNGGVTPIVVASISGFAASVAISQAICPGR
jgi:lactobin A/cerein 7B family class IIb bacteriocin